MTAHARLAALAIALLVFATLVVHVRLGLDRRPDLSLAEELWRTGRYFTILTVALLGVHSAWIALFGRVFAAASGAVTVWITLVGAVYHTLLSRPLEGMRLYVDHTFHTVLPVLAVLWWVTFAPKEALRPMHAVLWLGWPGLYAAYALARGATDGRYPYFFLDPQRIGWPMVGVWTCALALVFGIAGIGLVIVGRRLARRRPG